MIVVMEGGTESHIEYRSYPINHSYFGNRYSVFKNTKMTHQTAFWNPKIIIY